MTYPEFKNEEEFDVWLDVLFTKWTNRYDESVIRPVESANKALEEYRVKFGTVCPYCFNKETQFFSNNQGEHQIECCGCGATGPLKQTKELAAQVWAPQAWAPKPKLKGPYDAEKNQDFWCQIQTRQLEK